MDTSKVNEGCGMTDIARIRELAERAEQSDDADTALVASEADIDLYESLDPPTVIKLCDAFECLRELVAIDAEWRNPPYDSRAAVIEHREELSTIQAVVMQRAAGIVGSEGDRVQKRQG